MKKLEWKTVKRKLKELKPLENNQFGKITDEKRAILKEKIAKLGSFEIPTIDTDDVLLTFNKRYFILLDIWGEDATIEAMYPNRPLTEQERKEIIISSNVHEGDWIQDILDKDYQDIDLDSLGVIAIDSFDEFGSEVEKEIDEMDEFKKEFDSISDEKAKYPLVPRFSEKHDAFIIISDNETDTAFIKTVLELGKTSSYKNDTVGESNVLTAKQFQKIWKSKS